jgi:tRNA (guanine37-N1)-methyltransferase
MVLKPEPLARAIKATPRQKKSLVVLLTPQGEKLTQALVRELSGFDQLVLVCSRYEGVDERIREKYIDREVSIGDYVVTGGELPAMILIDAVARTLPGVLGNEDSSKDESFSNDLLEYPHYTRPPEFEGLKVPDVLLSGNHKEIESWRKEKSFERTKIKRPDLLKTGSTERKKI